MDWMLVGVLTIAACQVASVVLVILALRQGASFHQALLEQQPPVTEGFPFVPDADSAERHGAMYPTPPSL